MAIKYITVFIFFAAVSAVPIELDSQQNYQEQYQANPIAVNKLVTHSTNAEPQEYDDAEYKFNYAVNDEHTGDVKTQEETRKGDHVVGRYTLIDADGYQRIVEYTADDHNGFQAVVHREPIQGYKAPIATNAQQYEKITSINGPIGSEAKYAGTDNYDNPSVYQSVNVAEYNYH